MIDEPPVPGVDARSYMRDESDFANRFAKLLCNLVSKPKTGAAKPGSTPTVEQLCREWSVDDTLNEVFVERGAGLFTYLGLPILSEMIHWLSRDDDLASGDNLVHAHLQGLPHGTELRS